MNTFVMKTLGVNSSYDFHSPSVPVTATTLFQLLLKKKKKNIQEDQITRLCTITDLRWVFLSNALIDTFLSGAF